MTDLEDLKKAWQSQSGIPQERFDEIGGKVKNSSELLQGVIFRRDMGETFAAAIVFVFFFLGLFNAKNWVDWSGYVIMVVAATTIPIVLWWARRRSLSSVSAANFRDFLDVEIDYLTRQVRLLQRVTWWYLLPLYVGMALGMIGTVAPHRDSFGPVGLTVVLALGAALYIYIWRMNQKARKNHLEPLLRYYTDMREALESGRDFSATEPPYEFLQQKPRKPISRRRRWLGISLTVVCTLLVVAASVALIMRFDARTGWFVLSTAPVIAILLVVVTGVGRRNPTE